MRSAASGILLLMLAAAAPAFAQQLTLQIEDIASPAFQASGISAELENGRFGATIKQLSFQGHRWKNLRLSCPKIDLGPDRIACARGALSGQQSWPVQFDYAPGAKRLVLDIALPDKERWHLDASWGQSWNVAARIENGKFAHFRSWLPPDMPVPSAGSVTGKLHFSGSQAEVNSADADVRLSDLAFSDTGGSHAGEKIGGDARFKARRKNGSLTWEGEALWKQGEVFWSPLYLTGGARLASHGSLDARQIALEQGTLHWPAIGDLSASGKWDRAGRKLSEARLQATQLELGALHENFVLPFLGNTALAKSTLSGRADFSGRYADGEILSLDLALDHASLQDKNGRVELHGVQLNLPWRAHDATTAQLAIDGGQLLALPLGGFKTAIQMHDRRFNIARLEIPLLGGELDIENFQAVASANGWQWAFEGGLTPVSMAQLSAALHWPTMHGTLAGVIPRVHFEAGKLTLDGALLIKAFDGTAVIRNLVLLDALSPAPRLRTDIDMRNLDLDLLTRTFSFGSMQGRVDVAVTGLELSAWKPVAFDADLHSSTGDYPRKISQRAVQNISSLGGAGAAAAIQRSFLGIFEQFGYSKLGLSCVLKNGICRMDGVAPAPNGYIIVQGGGIPAITVIGYNRNVSWDELITRLQRVTQGNAKPVVQ